MRKLEGDQPFRTASRVGMRMPLHEPTIHCIGAAILDPTGRPVGGIGVTTVTLLVAREETGTYAPALRAAAEPPASLRENRRAVAC